MRVGRLGLSTRIKSRTSLTSTEELKDRTVGLVVKKKKLGNIYCWNAFIWITQGKNCFKEFKEFLEFFLPIFKKLWECVLGLTTGKARLQDFFTNSCASRTFICRTMYLLKGAVIR